MIATTLLVVVLFYCVYLTIKLKSINDEYRGLIEIVLEDMQDDIGRICRLETEVKNLQKTKKIKKIEKSRRRSTKRRSKVS